MAEFNLNREPELVEGRDRLQQLSEEGEQLSKTVEEKMKEFSNNINFCSKSQSVHFCLYFRGKKWRFIDRDSISFITNSSK